MSSCCHARESTTVAGFGRSTHLCGDPAWVEAPSGQTSPCSKAYAVAADLVATSSFWKMLLRWRSTVRSLSTSSSAMARFVRPLATS